MSSQLQKIENPLMLPEDDLLDKMMQLSQQVNCPNCNNGPCDDCFNKMLARIAKGEKPIRTASAKTQKSRIGIFLKDPEKFKIYLEAYPGSARFPRKSSTQSPLGLFLYDVTSESIIVDALSVTIEESQESIQMPLWAQWFQHQLGLSDGMITAQMAARLVGSWVSDELADAARNILVELANDLKSCSTSLQEMLGDDFFPQSKELASISDIASKIKNHLRIMQDHQSQRMPIQGDQNV